MQPTLRNVDLRTIPHFALRPSREVGTRHTMATARTAAKTAADFLPATRRLTDLVAAARDCRGCGLYENATQVVFGQVAE